MALKETMAEMHHIIKEICEDLDKAGAGNRAAAQRSRTNSIKFEKVAKRFRKESVAAEKSGSFKKDGKGKKGKAAPKKAAAPKAKAKPAPKKSAKPAKKVVTKAKPKVKAKKKK